MLARSMPAQCLSYSRCSVSAASSFHLWLSVRSAPMSEWTRGHGMVIVSGSPLRRHVAETGSPGHPALL